MTAQDAGPEGEMDRIPETFTLPLVGGGCAVVTIPRSVTPREFEYLLRMIALMREGLVSDPAAPSEEAE